MSKAAGNGEYSGSPIEIIANQQKGGLLGASIPAWNRCISQHHLSQGRSFTNNPCCVSIIQARFVNFCKQLPTLAD
jgi:hypothetical protein